MSPLQQKFHCFSNFLGRTWHITVCAFNGVCSDEQLKNKEKIIKRRKKIARAVFSLVPALTISLVLTDFSTNSSSIPVLTPGDIANENIHSHITTNIEPLRRSKLSDEDIIRQVAPVFDYDDTIINAWISNWEQTFQTIRKTYYQKKDGSAKFSLEEMKQKIQELTGQTLPGRHLFYLHQKRFSYEIERTFLKIANRLTKKLLSSVDVFTNYYQTGIVVRDVHRSLHETLVNDLSRIWSVDHAREFLEHMASISIDEKREEHLKITSMIGDIIPANLTFNKSLTNIRMAAALGATKPLILPVQKGELLVSKGERVTEEKSEILRRIAELNSWHIQLKQVIFRFIIIFLFFFILSRLSITRKGLWHLNHKDSACFMATMLISVVFIKYALPLLATFFKPYSLIFGVEYLLPVSTGGMVIYLLMGKEAGYAFAIIHSILIGSFIEQSNFYSLWAIVVTVSAIREIRYCKERNDLYRAGFLSGLVGAVTVFAYCMIQSLGLQNIDWIRVLISCGFAFLSGILSSILTGSIIPMMESLFNFSTNLKLLELSNFNHPLLHQLMMKAPGTYHHSMIVGSLAEMAADQIRANGLLTRVSAYYHDIGKMNKPLYFIENQPPTQNPHDQLSPSMSVKILFSHVKLGTQLAQEYKLGKAITDIIQQHHGNSLVTYFYNKAKKSEQSDLDLVNESEFRYPCPRPQTREAGIVMLADACEAATRSISDPTASKIETMVHNIINRRFLEGQFGECDLTLRDLREIEKCFTRTLVSLYHHRIEYPGQQKALSMGKENSDEKTPAEVIKLSGNQ